jgi:hypothetical protein
MKACTSGADRGRMGWPSLGDLIERRLMRWMVSGVQPLKWQTRCSEADVGDEENKRTKEDKHTF